MKNGRLGIVVVALLVLAAIGLAVYGPMLIKEKAVAIPQDIQRPADTVITAKGLIESEDEVVLGSPVSGTILDISGNEGDAVKKGQPLVILDDAQVVAAVKVAEASLMEAKERLKKIEAGSRTEDIGMAKSRVQRADVVFREATSEYERLHRLYEKDAATLLDLSRAKEKMDVAEEELNEARINLDKTQRGERKEEITQGKAAVETAAREVNYRRTLLKDYRITAPFDGMVAERFKEPGEAVDIGTPVLTLVNPKKLRVLAELEETDAGRISEGSTVEVMSEAYPERVYQGKVTNVLSIIKRKRQKTFDPVAAFDINIQDIHIHLDEYEDLKIGMSVRVRFQR